MISYANTCTALLLSEANILQLPYSILKPTEKQTSCAWKATNSCPMSGIHKKKTYIQYNNKPTFVLTK
jgi:hypothetical protein